VTFDLSIRTFQRSPLLTVANLAVWIWPLMAMAKNQGDVGGWRSRPTMGRVFPRFVRHTLAHPRKGTSLGAWPFVIFSMAAA
jgi:hypothetical protein